MKNILVLLTIFLSTEVIGQQTIAAADSVPVIKAAGWGRGFGGVICWANADDTIDYNTCRIEIRGDTVASVRLLVRDYMDATNHYNHEHLKYLTLLRLLGLALSSPRSPAMEKELQQAQKKFSNLLKEEK